MEIKYSDVVQFYNHLIEKYEKQIISINHNLTYYPAGEDRASENHISTPKTEAGMRTIPMLDTVKDAFEMIWEELVGKTAIAIVNLPPRKMMGIDSEGMLISAVHEEDGREGLHLFQHHIYRDILLYVRSRCNRNIFSAFHDPAV